MRRRQQPGIVIEKEKANIDSYGFGFADRRSGFCKNAIREGRALLSRRRVRSDASSVRTARNHLFEEDIEVRLRSEKKHSCFRVRFSLLKKTNSISAFQGQYHCSKQGVHIYKPIRTRDARFAVTALLGEFPLIP